MCLSSRRDEMVGRGIGRKRNSQRKRSKLPSIFRAWATKKNADRGTAVRSSMTLVKAKFVVSG